MKSKEMKPMKSKEMKPMPKRKRKIKSTPYMVEGGDSKGKITYTYPTGNSEDY